MRSIPAFALEDEGANLFIKKNKTGTQLKTILNHVQEFNSFEYTAVRLVGGHVETICEGHREKSWSSRERTRPLPHYGVPWQGSIDEVRAGEAQEKGYEPLLTKTRWRLLFMRKVVRAALPLGIGIVYEPIR